MLYDSALRCKCTVKGVYCRLIEGLSGEDCEVVGAAIFNAIILYLLYICPMFLQQFQGYNSKDFFHLRSTVLLFYFI